MSVRVEKLFVEYCNRYINSKLILSTQELTNLLKLIATESELYSVLESSVKDFNFKEEFENAEITTASGTVLRFPHNYRALIALVASILYSFDNGSINVLDFLEKYFPAEDGVKQSFVLMGKAMVIPFRDAMVASLKGEEQQEELIEEVSPEKPSVPMGAVTHGGMILRAINKIIMEDGSIDKKVKHDYLIITDAAIHALEIKDLTLIRALFLSLTYVLSPVKGAMERLKELESCFKLYYVL